MKYMTLNSSCSYAGLANMLEHYGVDTDDRSIAMGMNLPYLFAYEDGTYMAGPMLQSAKWFNLFLNPIGLQMTETTVPAEELPCSLQQQKTAMLGLQVDAQNKHAVVYQGRQEEQLLFLNNKWETNPLYETILLTPQDLSLRVSSSVMVATLERTAPQKSDFVPLLQNSISVLHRNLSDIQMLCSQRKPVLELRMRLHPLFRPLLLDGITMLDLLGENDLAARFSIIQKQLLTVLRQDEQSVILLGDCFPVIDFEDNFANNMQLSTFLEDHAYNFRCCYYKFCKNLKRLNELFTKQAPRGREI